MTTKTQTPEASSAVANLCEYSVDSIGHRYQYQHRHMNFCTPTKLSIAFYHYCVGLPTTNKLMLLLLLLLLLKMQGHLSTLSVSIVTTALECRALLTRFWVFNTADVLSCEVTSLLSSSASSSSSSSSSFSSNLTDSEFAYNSQHTGTNTAWHNRAHNSKIYQATEIFLVISNWITFSVFVQVSDCVCSCIICLTYQILPPSLTYKVLTTNQPQYLHNLICVHPCHYTRSSSMVTLVRPPTRSSLKITNHSFRYAAPSLRNELPTDLREPCQIQSPSLSPMAVHHLHHLHDYHFHLLLLIQSFILNLRLGSSGKSFPLETFSSPI